MEPGNDPAPTSVELPDRVGRYPVTGMLGKGAMGIVYRASDPVIRRPVAIKAIRKELLSDAEQADSVLARFRNEVQAAGSLVHPGIVSVYEYGEDGGLAYIVMECVEGNSLRQYIDQTVRFAVADAVSIGAQLLDALHYAHERGVWHRDIKPSNLKITADGRLKVLDFGIARIESSNLTQVGVLMGTHGFIAPEQYLGTFVDHRADIFAAGVILYQLLSGVMPFRGSREAVMYKVCNTTPDPPSQVSRRPELEAFDPVVAKALATSPDNRFVSCAAFRDALLQAYDAPVNATVSEQALIRHALPAAQRGLTSPPLSSPPLSIRSSTLGGDEGGSSPRPFATRPGTSPPRSAPYDRIEPAPLPSALAPGRSTPGTAGASSPLDQMQSHLARMTSLRTSSTPSDDTLRITELDRNLARLIATRAAPPAGTETARLNEIERALAAMVSPRAAPAPVPVPMPSPTDSTGAGTGTGVATTYPPLPGSAPPVTAPVTAQMTAPAPPPAPLPAPADDDETLIDPRPATVRTRAQAPAPVLPSPRPAPETTPPAASPPPTGSGATAPYDRLTADDQQRAVRLLTHYLGPIARILAERVLRGNPSRSAFHARLAEHLPDPAERASFLRDVTGDSSS